MTDQSSFTAQPKRPNLKILTPAFGGLVESRYMHSILNLGAALMQQGISFTLETLPNCSLISLGRSIMIHRALQDPNWTHVLWIDSDIEFEPWMVGRLIQADVDIIGGFYPKKGHPISMASSPDPEMNDLDSDAPYYRTTYAATGFLMEKRHVIEGMREHYREEYGFFYQGSDQYVDLFPSFIDKEMPNRLYLTEDFAHCRMAEKAGYEVYMSKEFTLKHHGEMCYSKQNEEEMLREYERQGYIEIKQMYPDHEKIRREESAS